MVLNANSKQDLEDFKTYILVEKNFSEHTAKAYYSDILSYLIWLGSDECEHCKRQWIRTAGYYIKHFLEISPILTNTVSTKNTLHIKWLKRMGAKFSAPYLINDHYFQDFYIIKGD